MTQEDEYFEAETIANAEDQEHEEAMNEYHRLKPAMDIFYSELTKNDISAIASNVVENVLIHGNPLKVAESIKIMEEIIDAVKSDKRFKSYALDELSKHGKCFISDRGVKIEPMESGGRYDFKTCGDPVVIELEAKLKERQEFLKKLPKDGMNIVTSEGEVIHVFAPAKPATTSTYKVTFPKS